jgi:hypothetical protein
MIWYEYLGKNNFLTTLYTEVPQLVDVRISQIKIHDEGRRITIVFDMPCFPDKPPKKWVELGYNTAVIEVDFHDIQEILIKSFSSSYRGNIEIQRDTTDSVVLNISGEVQVKIKSMGGFIQDIRGYIKS